MDICKRTKQDGDLYADCGNYNGDHPPPAIELLAMEAGAAHRRLTDEPQMVVLRGAGKISIDGLITKMNCSGKIAFLPPGLAVTITAVEPLAALFFKVDLEAQSCRGFDLSELLKFTDGIKKLFSPLTINDAVGIYLDALTPFLNDGLVCPKYTRAKTTELFHILSRYYSRRQLAAFFLPVLDRDYVFRSMINRNIRRLNSVGEFASLMGMSRADFSAGFKRIYGQAPKTYISGIKAELIRKDLTMKLVPLKEVARINGFKSYEVFSRFCTKMFGHAPGEIRRAVKDNSFVRK